MMNVVGIACAFLQNVSLKKQALKILIVSLLLQGCGGGSSEASSVFIDTDVKIAYFSKENVTPATWKLTVDTDETLSFVQWQFSDENFVSHVSGQSLDVTHTFNRPGTYRIRLQYETASGQKGTTESDVVIRSGIISGTIYAPLNSLVDVDTRDPDEPDTDNNSFENAQPILAKTRLSGVLDTEDLVDYYQVRLQKNQTINLQVADQIFGNFEQIEFRVFTNSDTLNPLFQMETQSSTGQLSSAFIAPEAGSYFIKLAAISPTVTNIRNKNVYSHGIYSLQVEAPVETADFVSGELIVMMKETVTLEAKALITSTSTNVISKRTKSKNQTVSNFEAQGFTYRKDLGRIKALSLTNTRQFMASKNIRFSESLEDNHQWQTLQAARLLSAQEDILFAEPNWKRYPTALNPVADPLYRRQWHYANINLEPAWQEIESRGADTVIVAVLDTGVLTSHPDLSSNLVAGYDFIDNDADADDPGDKSIGGQRSSFHGTHVAGTIAAAVSDTGNGVIGGTGVAPGVKVMPVRVLGSEGGTSIDIIAGMCFAAQLNSSDNSLCQNVNSSIDGAADIINLSLGGPGFSQAEQAVYNAVIAKGIIVIAAAGNEASSQSFYPAAYDGVISVSATNRNTELASYSNFGNTIDVTAPGGEYASDDGVLSTWGDDLDGTIKLTYGYLQGTSMAAPHVAGVAALMKTVKSELTHDMFLGYLNSNDLTQDIGAPGKDNQFGYGLIDAHKAVLAVLDTSSPKILSSTNNLFFDVSQISRSFNLIASGVETESDLGSITATMSGVDNESGGTWLALNKSTGLGQYIATVDRTGMEEGVYNGVITITSDQPGISFATIDVALQIGNAQLTANAGVQYVLILKDNIEANNEGVLASVAGSSALIASNGEYRFQVAGLAKGEYTVSTGSDLDFDNLICDAGESCGQYPTLAQPTTIVISEKKSTFDINMTVNYLTNSIGSSSVVGDSMSEIRAIQKPSSLQKINVKEIR